MSNNKVIDEHKKQRVKQLESFDYIRFSCLHEDKVQPVCKEHNGEIEESTNGTFTNHWLNCGAERCGCQLYGESKQSLKRKGLQLSK